MNERIKLLAEQAGMNAIEPVMDFDRKETHWNGWASAMEKFAELIVRECTAALFDESERLSGLYSEEDNWNSADEYEIRSNQCIDNMALIEKHFGVEE